MVEVMVSQIERAMTHWLSLPCHKKSSDDAAAARWKPGRQRTYTSIGGLISVAVRVGLPYGF